MLVQESIGAHPEGPYRSASVRAELRPALMEFMVNGARDVIRLKGPWRHPQPIL